MATLGPGPDQLNRLAKAACDAAHDRELADHIHKWDELGESARGAWREVVLKVLEELPKRCPNPFCDGQEGIMDMSTNQSRRSVSHPAQCRVPFHEYVDATESPAPVDL